MTDYKGIDEYELREHHGRLLRHITGGLGGSSARKNKVQTLFKDMLDMNLDREFGYGHQSKGKVTQDEYKKVVDTLLESKEIYPHEAAELHRRAANAFKD